MDSFRKHLLQENDQCSAFMEEYFQLTEPHPYSRGVRVYGMAMLMVSKFGKEIHISDIATNHGRQGHGTAAMKMLCDLADKHQVVLSGIAQSYSKGNMTTAQLKKWYAKFGFKAKGGDNHDGWNISRSPS